MWLADQNRSPAPSQAAHRDIRQKKASPFQAAKTKTPTFQNNPAASGQFPAVRRSLRKFLESRRGLARRCPPPQKRRAFARRRCYICPWASFAREARTRTNADRHSACLWLPKRNRCMAEWRGILLRNRGELSSEVPCAR